MRRLVTNEGEAIARIPYVAESTTVEDRLIGFTIQDRDTSTIMVIDCERSQRNDPELLAQFRMSPVQVEKLVMPEHRPISARSEIGAMYVAPGDHRLRIRQQPLGRLHEPDDLVPRGRSPLDMRDGVFVPTPTIEEGSDITGEDPRQLGHGGGCCIAAMHDHMIGRERFIADDVGILDSATRFCLAHDVLALCGISWRTRNPVVLPKFQARRHFHEIST